MIGDPYEEANNVQPLDDARIVSPQTPKKSRKIFVAGMVLVGMFLAVVMLANIASLVTGKAPDPNAAPKPLTMTKQQSDSFAQQQSSQAVFLKGIDGDKNTRNTEDTVLGYGKGLASDTFEEVDGFQRRRKRRTLRNGAP